MHELIASRLLCPRCGLYLEEHSFHSTCPNCGALLDFEVQSDVPAGKLRQRFDRKGSGVWRYRELILPSVKDEEIVSYPEGNTPLVANEAVAQFAGVPGLMIKHEGMNPTGSFKDRGMTVAITQAKRIGAKAVACASTGNTSASLAAYAALAGLPSLVLIPAGKISSGKLAQTVAHGAKTIHVRGNFDDCLRLLREASDRLGVYVVNSVNPFRLAGQRSIVFEMLHQLDWKAPDWIVLPAGNLGNTSAFGEALALAKKVGIIDSMPRLLAVQAAGASPFAQGFATNRRVTVDHPETVATAIRIGAPASWDRALRAITLTGGSVIDVTDAQIMDAKRSIDRAGIGCEPASAAAVAGVRKGVESGLINRADRVVAVLTGHLLKDPAAIIEGDSQPVGIDASLEQLQRAIEG